MKLALLGKINCRGGSDPGAALVSPDVVAVIMRFGETTTLACLRLGPLRRSFKLLWQREFKGDIYHQWAGQKTPINLPTVIHRGNGSLYAIGGTERLLLDGATGRVLARGEASASPSAPATLQGEELIVPEGKAVAAYDATTLQPLWRKPTPSQTWAFASYSGGVIPVQEENSGSGALWSLPDERLWPLRDVEYPSGTPLIYGSLVIVPSGNGAPGRLTAITLTTGLEQWRIDCARAELSQPPAQGPFPVPNPAVALPDRVLVITAGSHLDAIAISDGYLLWQVKLTSEPIVLSFQENRAWVGARDGSILIVDPKNGALLDQSTLPGSSFFASSIIPLPAEKHSSTRALAVGYLGNVYLMTGE